MSIAEFVFWAIIAVVLVYAVVVFNHLVTLKHNVKKAWSNIDVLLKQRHEELPKLVETCRQYMQFEQQTLEKVMQARAAVSQAQAKGDIGALGMAETEMRLGLGNLFAVAEAYPELKANESFQHLQQRISGLENAIADRREFYNESVNINNIQIEQFPDLIIAGLFRFKAFELLEFNETETADVDIKTLFQG
ncbi:MAG: LemA family protein [Methylophaga sp.]|nr:LemA family protein [Methylophaga sp.]